MADYSIPTSFIKTYESNIQLLVQQLETQFRDKVFVKPLSGQKHYVDFIGTATPAKRLASAAPTVHTNLAHSRSRIMPETYDLSTLVDRNDILRMGTDPSNDYLKAFRAGYNRLIDQLILSQAIGSRYAVTTDDETETVTALGAGQTVAEAGTAIMSLAKLRAALQIFNENDVPPEEEKMLGMTPQAITDLLNEPEVIDSQANVVALNAIQEGKIMKLFGFNIFMTNRLPAATANIQDHVAWVRNGVCLGIMKDIESRMSEESQYNYAIQLWMSMDFGVTRMQEKQVVKIQTYEA
jgi:hypothetical protein